VVRCILSPTQSDVIEIGAWMGRFGIWPGNRYLFNICGKRFETSLPLLITIGEITS